MEEGFRIRRMVDDNGEYCYEVYELADPLGRDAMGNRSAIARFQTIEDATYFVETVRHTIDESEEVPG